MRRAAALLLAWLVLPWGTAFAAPNDPGWAQQWHLAKIRADRAWATSKGSGIVVAIVDTGIDLRHPDLRGRLVAGRDFVGNDSSAQDDNGHGTFMAGIVAAATGNGTGVASVAPAAKLMPIRVLNADGTGDPDTVAEGIDWAVAHGADVINLSLAETTAGGQNLSRFFTDSSLDRAIRAAADAGRFVAIAAGNNFTESGGSNRTAYTARDAGVLVVGASTASDRRAAYSNYGDGLDVVAPGGGSATTADPRSCDQNDPIVSAWWNPEDRISDYGAGCGSSMAVAHVAGVAALLMARGYSSTAAAQRIVSTAVDIGTAGRDDRTGNGRVDAAAAVGPAPARPAQPRATSAPKAPPKKVATAASPTSTPSPRPSPTPTPTADPVLAVDGPRSDEAETRTRLLAFATALALAVGVAHPLARRSFVR